MIVIIITINLFISWKDGQRHGKGIFLNPSGTTFFSIAIEFFKYLNLICYYRITSHRHGRHYNIYSIYGVGFELLLVKIH